MTEEQKVSELTEAEQEEAARRSQERAGKVPEGGEEGFVTDAPEADPGEGGGETTVAQ